MGAPIVDLEAAEPGREDRARQIHDRDFPPGAVELVPPGEASPSS